MLFIFMQTGHGSNSKLLISKKAKTTLKKEPKKIITILLSLTNIKFIVRNFTKGYKEERTQLNIIKCKNSKKVAAYF